MGGVESTVVPTRAPILGNNVTLDAAGQLYTYCEPGYYFAVRESPGTGLLIMSERSCLLWVL